MSKALSQMQYHMSMAHGIDPNPITESSASRLFGKGQGSGASPTIWLAMSEVLIQALKNFNSGTNFISHYGTVKHQWVNDAFVDDSTVWDNQILEDVSYTMENLCLSIQKTAQMWEKFLSLSGGTLNLKNASTISWSGNGSEASPR